MVKRIIYKILVVLGVQSAPFYLIAQQPSVYKVEKMPFNTEYFNEISPVIMNDGILFCSDKRFSSIKDRTSFDGRRLYNMYLAERKDTSGWLNAKELKSERSSKFNSGPFCFAPDKKTVYFTSEVETGKITQNKKFRNHSGIFIAELSGTELLSVRPFKYNNSQYEVGQPSVSNDGRYLYFASTMPGGQGGSDIYYCELINNEWSLPVNLGPRVNSPASENYPYIHPAGKLYFTSNRSGGIGRLDVYSTTMDEGTWENPVLLPEPINSPADDFAFVAEISQQKGYFSSNRTSNDDIYSFSSTIRRMETCDTLIENSYCFRFMEENAAKLDTTPFRYEWKFGDGNKAVGVVVEHCYAGPGAYLVQLDVVNLITKEVLYNEKSDSLIITDIEQPYITAPEVGETGRMIRLNADKTYLPGWNISQYYWNFGDETIHIGREVDKTYIRPGTYNIQLIVSEEPVPGGMTREKCICKNITISRQP
jgi:hypothetical protein